MEGISGGSSSPGGGDQGKPSGSDRDSSNDRPSASSADTKSDKNTDSSQRGMTGSERTSFDNALSDAGNTSGGLSDPSNTDTNRDTDDAAQAAARNNHPANEFSGLGPGGGPIDHGLSGDDSRNSHRGFGSDDSLAGGIDDGVDAGLAATEASHPANEFGGLGSSGGPIDDLGKTEDAPEHDFSGTVNDVAAVSNGLLDAGVTLSKHGVLSIGPTVANTMESVSRYAGPGGRFAGSIAETTEAVMNADSGDETRSGVVGALSSLDDLAVSAFGGLLGGIGGGAFTAMNPVGIGLGAAGGSTAASITYDGSGLDKALDDMVDKAVRNENGPDDLGPTRKPGPMR